MTRLFLAITLAVVLLSPSTGYSETSIEILKGKQRGIAVLIDGKLFTQLDIDNYRRPILYPVMGPGQTPLTRHYPMVQGTAGEAEDHPHHKSIWCGHGLINGVSFWHEEGQIKVDYSKPLKFDVVDGAAMISFHCNYVGPNYELVCTDSTRLTFHDLGDDLRAIDWDVTIHASQDDLLFGDTKEGMMAIRTHPQLRIDKGAAARNSNGTTGAEIWGKKAAWVDYSGEVEDQQVGIAIFDHPQNLRHPTTWHARAYGLVAANPFGLSHFQGKPKGSGDLQLARGESIRFRYRFVFYRGSSDAAKLAELYDSYKKH